MATATTTTLYRDGYGCLCADLGHRWVNGVQLRSSEQDVALLRAAHGLAGLAAKLGLIEPDYDGLEWDRKRRASGSARHHEVYDLTTKRGRIHQVLLCVRETQGNGKYGVSTTSKDYVILTRCAKAVEIQTANKAIAAKAAKQAGTELGKALEILQGRAAFVPNRLDLSTVYKRVAVAEDGRYLSIFDGQTAYRLGEEIREAARQDHNGGIYCYPTAEAARAWEAPSTWPGAKLPHVVLRCSAGGSYCRYDNGKISVSRLTPLEVVA